MANLEDTVPDKTALPPQQRSEPAIDPNAPAGSEHSLGAESVRDGRPATDDKIIEAIDEEDPAIAPPGQ
jgi:hypothetical protein